MPDEPGWPPPRDESRSEELTVAFVLLVAGALGVATNVARGASSASAGGLGVVFFIGGVFALRAAPRRRRRRR